MLIITPTTEGRRSTIGSPEHLITITTFQIGISG